MGYKKESVAKLVQQKWGCSKIENSKMIAGKKLWRAAVCVALHNLLATVFLRLRLKTAFCYSPVLAVFSKGFEANMYRNQAPAPRRRQMWKLFCFLDLCGHFSVRDDVVFCVDNAEYQPTLRFLQRFDERLVAFLRLLPLRRKLRRSVESVVQAFE